MREKLRRSPTLYRQLTVIAIITIAIPLFVMSAFLHYNAVNAYNRINKQAADTSMHDAYNKLELSFERIISLANKVASDNRVLGIMEKALTDDYPLDKRLDDVRLLRNTISSYENSEAGCSIRLVFPKHQSLLTNNGYTSITLATLKDVLAENDVQINDSTIISHPVWIGNEINIHLEMNVDESLYECRIPNMLLQPLVENSYVHGFFGRISGTISVTVQRSEDNIVLIVEDDGIGMSKDEIQRSLNNAQVENGYGIYSIVERVKLRYGSRASFSATSDNRNGCRIEIRLPYEC